MTTTRTEATKNTQTQEPNGNSVFVLEPKDIYQIRHQLNRYYYGVDPENSIEEIPALNASHPRFILGLNKKDGYTTLLCNIMEDGTQKPLASIFLDSHIDPEYFRHLEYRFNYKGYYFYHNSPKIKEHKVEMDGISFLNKNESSLNLDIAIDKNIPFIDASHDLQKKALFKESAPLSKSMLKAISEMLGNKEKAQEVYNLAKAAATHDKDATNKLASIFKNDLKAYLPQYYDNKNNLAVKSEEEIKTYLAPLLESTNTKAQEAEPKKVVVTDEKITTEIQKEVLQLLEDEYNRMLKKQSSLSDPLKTPYKPRLETFGHTIEKIKFASTQFNLNQDKKTYHADLLKAVTDLANNPEIEKYKPYQKLLLKVLNAIAMILTGVIPGIIKYNRTGTLFFSIDGKSKDAANNALDNTKQIVARN